MNYCFLSKAKNYIMSIFRKIFKPSKSWKELELEEYYFEKYKIAGISKADIQETISDCKRKAELEGDINFGDNFGNELLLKVQQGDNSSLKVVSKSLSGGATEEDIRSWWNLNYLERRMIKWEDDLTRMMTFKSLKNDKGLSSEQAIINLRKAFPIYGDSTDERNSTGEDRPLPDELHLRINKLIQKSDKDLLKDELSKYNTMNAYLRDKLKSGK